MFGFRDPNHVEAIDYGFNAAVMTMANKTLPYGWRVEPSYSLAPMDLVSLNVAMNDGGMVVWGGASEDTIYGSSVDHNYAFRAWHDGIHYRHQLPFTVAGEAACAYVQIFQLIRQYGDDDETRQWASYILAEVLAQALHKVKTGEFPVGQRSFTVTHAMNLQRLANAVVTELSGDKVTELQALRLAAAEWGRP